MSEFQVGGFNYRTDRKIDVFKQNNIVRRLMPALGGIGAALAASDTKPGDLAQAAGEQFLENLGPITNAIAGMTDADSDYIFKTCLGVVSRQMAGGTGWAHVLAANGSLMYEDIGLADMYQITWKVIEENLSGFFSSIGQLLPQPEEPSVESTG